jgi:hypothetical protein
MWVGIILLTCAGLGGWAGYYGRIGLIVLIRALTMLKGISRSALVRTSNDSSGPFVY